MKKNLLLLILIAFNLSPSQGFAQSFANPPAMALIAAGEFVKGKPGSSETLYLDGFYIDQFEVTQGEFEQVMQENPAFFKGQDRPVEKVTWVEGDAFCRKAGKRLPTEWEWEKAAKAGAVTPYYWGGQMDDAFAWHKGNSGKQTHPVGLKKPNAYGLYDMSGNVWEWTASDHESSGKVVRGGSWRNSAISLRSFQRIPSLPIHRFHYVGFRCAQSISDLPEDEG